LKPVPFQPLNDVIVCVKSSSDVTRDSGIIIPAMFDDQEEAEVVAVGPGKYINAEEREPMQIQVGDRILFNKYQVQEITLFEQKYLTMRQEHVRTVLNR
jgi:chaperonin GroES